MKIKRMLFVLILIVISVSCSLPTVITPTATAILSSDTPVSSATMVSSATPVDTATPVPTATPVDTATPVFTNTPSLTPTLGPAMVTPNTTTNVNCRYGPSTDYATVGALVVGSSTPILGTSADHAWWLINNPFGTPAKCWVSAAVTTASGNVAVVPIVAAPAAQVTNVSITVPDVTILGHCGGPNATSFKVSITTNGPANVIYHLSIYNGDGSLRNETAPETLSFASADTQTFDPGGAYKTDCGDFYAKVIVTAPNSMSAQVNWTVIEP